MTATGVMLWPGWVGVMNWFMMTWRSASRKVGQPPPHKSSAVESADSFTAGDTSETRAGTTVAVTTTAATPTDTVIRVAMGRNLPMPSATANAPIRPM
ncbi:hypothetical protein [Mycolicibacterium sp. P9-64]|uniref:hypothetical protein n=1 Tax=Mycolicibacterium sp. P9-64 TaxID=2024612 RepID=UPI001F5B4938|nr:hypothetical protein [Mycolicibacterium sp. P9-64]